MRSLPNIEAFVRVAETLSFAEASRRLSLSPSAVSKAVARLEEELGIKLLHRTTRSVRLTIEGEDLYEGCRRLLGELETLQAEMSRSSGEPRGRLSVSVPSALGRLSLVPMLSEFSQTYPEVNLDLSLEDPFAGVAKREVDVSIHLGSMADSANLVARKWFESPLIVCATTEYLDENGRPEHPDELATHTCVVYRNRSTGRPLDWGFRLKNGLEAWKPEARLVVDDPNAVAQAALTGAGLAQMPAYLFVDGLRERVLEEVLQSYRPPELPVYIAYLDRRFVSPRIRAFVDFLIDHTSEITVWDEN